MALTIQLTVLKFTVMEIGIKCYILVLEKGGQRWKPLFIG